MALIADGVPLQVVQITTTAQQTFNNANGTIVSGTITPVAPNSRFKIWIVAHTNTSDDSDAQNGVSNPYCGCKVERSVAGGSYASADYLGTGGASSYTQAHMDISPYRAGASVNYNAGARYRMTNKVNVIIDEPTYSLGQTITYRLLVITRRDGYMGWIQMGAPEGFGGDDNYFNFPYGLHIQEIGS